MSDKPETLSAVRRRAALSRWRKYCESAQPEPDPPEPDPVAAVTITTDDPRQQPMVDAMNKILAADATAIRPVHGGYPDQPRYHACDPVGDKGAGKPEYPVTFTLPKFTGPPMIHGADPHGPFFLLDKAECHVLDLRRQIQDLRVEYARRHGIIPGLHCNGEMIEPPRAIVPDLRTADRARKRPVEHAAIVVEMGGGMVAVQHPAGIRRLIGNHPIRLRWDHQRRVWVWDRWHYYAAGDARPPHA